MSFQNCSISFDLSPVFFGNFFHQLGNDRVAAQQVVGQQQLGVVVNALKQEGHGAGQGVALGHQQHAVQLAIAVACEFEFGDFGGAQAREFVGQLCGVGEDVWQTTRGAGQRPVAVAQVVMKLHVAQRGKAVEPGVGDGFHRVGKAVFADAGDELLALGVDLDGPGLAGDHGDVALRLAGGHVERAGLVTCFVRDAQQVGAGGDGGDEVFAGLGGVGLEVGLTPPPPPQSPPSPLPTNPQTCHSSPSPHHPDPG